MTPTLRLHYAAPPSALAFMARAFVPSPGFDRASLPDIEVRLTGYRIPPAALASFHALTGLPHDGALSMLAPHVFGFRLLMTVVTHPKFPLPIWNSLQVRNQLRLHRRLAADQPLDYVTRICAARVLAKGVEFDLHSTASDGEGVAWESVNTFYYRGRFGEPTADDRGAQAPDVPGRETAVWTMNERVGRKAGELTGDYNGIHTWDRYARRFGFRGAFHHPQVVIGQALARLGEHSAAPGSLETWLKGPVYYGEHVTLRAEEFQGERVFAVLPASDPRPAIVGRLRG